MAWIRKSAGSVSSRLLSLPDPSHFVSRVKVNELREYLAYIYGEGYLLTQLVSYGIAFHHGHLPQHTREIIEDAYKVLRDSVVVSAFEIINKKKVISEQPKVKIGPVKKGELELPKGKDVEETSEEHFKNLIKKDGWEKVSKRIIALKVWNKNRNPALSKKMDTLQAKLAKWVESKREKSPDFAS